MEILQISLAVVSAVVLLLGVLVVYLKSVIIKELDERYIELRNNLKYDFERLRRDIDRTAERVTELRLLPVIGIALQEKELKELNEEKNRVEKKLKGWRNNFERYREVD